MRFSPIFSASSPGAYAPRSQAASQGGAARSARGICYVLPRHGRCTAVLVCFAARAADPADWPGSGGRGAGRFAACPSDPLADADRSRRSRQNPARARRGRAACQRLPGRGRFVSLAPVSDPGLVPSAIVQALDLRGAGTESPVDRLKAWVGEQRFLLVLDNFDTSSTLPRS